MAARRQTPHHSSRAAHVTAKRELLLEAALSVGVVSRNPSQVCESKILIHDLVRAACDYEKAVNT